MIENIKNGYKTSFISKDIESNIEYQTKILTNNNEKLILKIREELKRCDEFIFSVAFITESGVTLILEQLKELEKRGIKGKILTGRYLNFTQPKALKKILSYRNIELRLIENDNFHSKGFFFREGKQWRLIIGSSNLTQTALTTNIEWNVSITSLEDGKFTIDCLNEFNNLFSKGKIIDDKLLEEYEKIYIESKKIKKLTQNEKIEPNIMQLQALENLKELRRLKKSKGLLISATGTGKTYLSAFDIKNFKGKNILFIAHRKTILERAKITYDKVIPNTKATFLMIQTISKEENLKRYDKEEFDYIVIDEAHHTGAKSYEKVIEYFKPKFLLGMTATPERMDNFNIYDIFDYNIAHEIRLYQALEEKLLVPFHYFGIKDIVIDGISIDEESTIKDLVIDDRVKHILEKSRYYGYSGDKLRALVFVSRVEEGEILSRKFNELGVKSAFISSKTTDIEREKIIEQLESGKIEYIFSIDVFNEGVDIPSVNQVIFLRATQSSTIYIQQLGRGLRKAKDKEYLVVLDFIGNYKKNFLIPIALSQNNRYDKDFLRRFLISGTNYIPGESSVIFEEIVQNDIFKSIADNNFVNKKNIEENFTNLKTKLGRIPFLLDFFKNDMIDPAIILKYKKDYDEILKIMGENIGILSKDEKNILVTISSFLTPGKRIHEFYILKKLLDGDRYSLEELNNQIEQKYNLLNQYENSKNAILHLSRDIFKNLSTAKQYIDLIEKKDEKYSLKDIFIDSIRKNNYFKTLILDIIEYNIEYIQRYYKPKNSSLFLYKEYTKQEAFKYLNLEFNNAYQVSGYTPFEKERMMPIFLTIENGINTFFNNREFAWYSKKKRVLKRNDKLTVEGKIGEGFFTIYVFVKKDRGENFFYLGTVENILKVVEKKTEDNEDIVEYIFRLKNNIDEDLMRYLNI